MKVGRQARNLKLGQIIVFVCEVADGPDQTGGRDFRFDFGAQLYFPLLAILAGYDDFRIGAGEVFFDELEDGALGRMAFAALAKAEIGPEISLGSCQRTGGTPVVFSTDCEAATGSVRSWALAVRAASARIKGIALNLL